MKLASIVGARPQFIKAALISREIRKKHTEILIHTGQHYDKEMSDVFFKTLSIPEPDYNLGIGSAEPGKQTGRMIIAAEKVLMKENPDMVLVYGDTNTTLAGALAAVKIGMPIAHVEAGLRSYNRQMPEEVNRVIVDHVSRLLFCPTNNSVENLKKEGITQGVYNVGDVMYDIALSLKNDAEKSSILGNLDVKDRRYLLVTIHRAGNTDRKTNIKEIISAMEECGSTFIFPVHPRTLKYLKKYGMSRKLARSSVIKVVPPLDYFAFQKLLIHARKVLTDSGGVQKEAYFFRVPCITLRDETEWMETVNDGWNVLVGANKQKIINAVQEFEPSTKQTAVFGDGETAKRIVQILEQCDKKPNKPQRNTKYSK